MTGTLLILQDSHDFGGHEAMFLRFLPAILERGIFDRIVIRYPAGNDRLEARLKAFASPTFDVQGWEFAKRRAEPYLAPFRRRYAGAVKTLFAQERPKTTLLLQGRIENCVVPMLAVPHDAYLVSYVPMAHRLAEMGRRGFPADLVRRRLYGRPNHCIVPGPAIVGQIARAGGTAPVTVADNTVAAPERLDRAEARIALGIDADANLAVFLGRMDVGQKGLDTLFDAIRRDADALSRWTFLFVGSGEGAGDCDRLRHDLEGRVAIKTMAWSDAPHRVLAAADVLLLPSRWEGVPLVMLEAMHCGLPILGSQIDVFEHYLPAANRTDFAHRPLAAVLDATVAPAAVAAFRERAEDHLARVNLAVASDAFVSALQPENGR